MTAAPSITSAVVVLDYAPVPHVRIDVDAPGAVRLTVYRVTEFGREAVREAENLLAAEGAFVQDFEAPQGLDFHYIAQAFDRDNVPSPVGPPSPVLELPGEDCIIQDPRDPTTAVVASLTAEALESMVFAQDQSLSTAIGQSRPSGTVGTRQRASNVPLDVFTYTREQTHALFELIQRAGVLLFRLPASSPDHLKGYWAVQAGMEAMDPVKKGDVWKWKLTGVMVERPGFTAVVHHGTYADLERWPSYAHIEAAYGTYAELEGSPFYDAGIALEWFEPDPDHPGVWILTDGGREHVRFSGFPGLYEFDVDAGVMVLDERSGAWVPSLAVL
jgi:hypothetical protein